MAEIVEQLRFDIDEALRDVGRIETALDRALASVEVRLDSASANRQLADLADNANRALDDIDVGFDSTTANRQLDDLARTADRALSDIDLDIDTTQVSELESVLREVERIADRAATETQSMALAAGRAEVNFEDLARAMGVTEDRARDVTTELLQSQAASNRLEDSARDVARQLGLSDREAERLAGSLREADRAADAIDVTAIGLGTRFAALRTSAVLMAGALSGVGIGAGLALAVTGANAAIQSFARLEDSINAVNVVFREGAAVVLEFGETAAESAGLSQEAFNQAVAPIGALLTNFGFDVREAADAAVILVQRGADLASVYGGTVPEALLAINSALVGQVEPLRRFGGEISQARVEAFALATGLLQAGQEMDTATAVQARYGLILKDTSVVAGDFVNTSDDLANAQRSASGELQNFVSDIGEDLAPALETLLVLIPDVVEGLRQLVPGFANAANSAANFFETVGQGGGFREEAASAEAFFSALTIGPGLAAEAGQALGGLVEDVVHLDGQFTRSTAALVRGGALIERTFTQNIGRAMAIQLDKGTDAVDAFNQAIRQTASSTSSLAVFTESFQGLSIAANLTDEELRTATQGLIANADAAGLTAQEVEYLNGILTQLNGLLAVDTRRRGPFQELTPDIREVATTFTTFVGDLESGTDRAATALAELAAAAEAQQARTAGAFNLFEELPEKIKGSFVAAVDVLRESVEAIADFEINIALLEALDLDALAADFQDKGIAFAGQLEEALNNIPLAIEADALLQGMGVIGEDMFDELVAQFVKAGIDGADVERLKRNLASPQVIAAAEEAARSVAGAGGDAFRDTSIEHYESLIPEVGETIGRSVETHWNVGAESDAAARATAQSYVDGLIGFNIEDRLQGIFDTLTFSTDLSEQGRAGADSYAFGFQEELASRDDSLRKSITDWVENATYADSPPKLFLDFGREAGDAYWSGFEVVDPPTVPIPEVVFPPIILPEVVFPPIILPDIPTITTSVEVSIPEIDPTDFTAIGVEAGDAYRTAFDGLVLAEIEPPPITVPEIVIPEIAAPVIPAAEFVTPDLDPTGFEAMGVDAAVAFVAGFDLSRTILEPPTVTVPDIVIPPIVLPPVPTIELPVSDLDPAAFANIGVEAGGAFITGITTGTTGEATRLRDAVLDALDAAIERDSPPRLFTRAGQESGETFWAGFDIIEPPTVQAPEVSIPEFNPVDFTDVGIEAGQSFTQGFTDEVRRLEGEFRLRPELDPLTADQIVSLNLDPNTQVFTGFDPLTISQLQQLMDEELGKLSPSTEIQFDFDLQALQDQLGALADLGGTVGVEARAALMAGLSTLSNEEITRLRASIVDAVNDALEAKSPSRIMLDLGQSAGEAFWAGFNQADLTLRTPVAPITGRIADNSTPATSIGANVQLVINNPTVQDAVSDAARLNQIASSIATTYRQVT